MLFNKKRKFLYCLGSLAVISMTTTSIISCSVGEFSDEVKSLKKISKDGIEKRILELQKYYVAQGGNLDPNVVIADVFYLDKMINGNEVKDIGIIQLVKDPKYDYQQVFGYFHAKIEMPPPGQTANSMVLNLLALQTAHFFYTSQEQQPLINTFFMSLSGN